MKKLILFTTDAKVLFTAFVSFQKESTSTPAPPAPLAFLVQSRHTMRKTIQKFVKWKNEFFTLDGFDNYNDVYS
jgi:hypothetical protein